MPASRYRDPPQPSTDIAQNAGITSVPYYPVQFSPTSAGGGGSTGTSPSAQRQPQTKQQQCLRGTRVGNGLISEGSKIGGDGAAISAAGGIIIAGGAVATATVVAAPEGVAAMAGGATVATIGGGVSMVGLGIQAVGAAYNFGVNGWSSFRSTAAQAGATVIDAVVGHFFPNLPDVLGPYNPIDATANAIAGPGTCP